MSEIAANTYYSQFDVTSVNLEDSIEALNNGDIFRSCYSFDKKKIFWFAMYKLNIPKEYLEQADEDEYPDQNYKYDATDTSGRCFFDDNLTMFRMNDDWYVSIRCNEDADSHLITEFLFDAYLTIYGSIDKDLPKEVHPRLIFLNTDVL